MTKKLKKQKVENFCPKLHNIGQEGFTSPIGWNFSFMDQDSDLPWSCTFEKLSRYWEKLASFERHSFRDLENMNDSNHNWESYDNMNKDAKEYLEKHKIDSGALWQLRFSNLVRLFGVRDHNIFRILWLDEKHEIYPVGKKHT